MQSIGENESSEFKIYAAGNNLKGVDVFATEGGPVHSARIHAARICGGELNLS